MKLQDLDHLRDDKRIRFSEETVNGETVTIVAYMIGDRDLWDKPLATECRGIVFNSSGDCISRPFHKFFNVGECEATQLHSLPELTEVLEKRDGSMLVPVIVGGQTAWKTKKSFYSDVAVDAAKNVPAEVIELAKDILEMNMTPVFEYTSEQNRIVLDYGSEPNFVLLAIRRNETGEYSSYDAMNAIAEAYGVEVIKKYDLTLQDCLEQTKTLENFEGWCLRDPATGFYVKLKCEWYLRMHKARTELRERDVADMVIAETIDDIKSALSLDGFNLTPIEEIERRVAEEIANIRETVDYIVATVEDKTNFKAIAAKYKDHAYFGLIMSAVRGKEPDYKKYWQQNFRDNYSLKTVYSGFHSGA